MYYHPNIANDPTLPEEESAHCVQVLRAKIGDRVEVTDGVGHIYHCRVTNPHRKHCELSVDSVETPAPLHRGWVHVAVAPTKMMERLEWFIEKATEMGIDEITLLRCDHSERKEVKMERLQKVMIAAAKQSLRATFPIIHDMVPCREFLSRPCEQGLPGYIAYCEEGYAPSDGRRFLRDHDVDAPVLIGPEGDFSPAEIALAKQNGWIPVSLGNGRLRTETAALVACHTCVLRNE